MEGRDEGRTFLTDSGIPLERVYTREHISDLDPDEALGVPGGPPFTRGPYPNGYRERPWRILQIQGSGTPEDERARIKYLLAKGETGFVQATDTWTWDLLELDQPEVAARPDEVGMHGMALTSLRDYEIVLDGIPIEKMFVHPGMTTPMQSAYLGACYFALAENRGIPIGKLQGTGQNDFFLGYLSGGRVGQVPPAAGLRLACDMLEFCVEHVPKFGPVSIASYNVRENGVAAHEELAILLAVAIAYLDEVAARGRLKVDDVAHWIGGVAMACDRDFFEEIAKLRAARRMWYKLLHDRYGIRDEASLKMRIHTLTAGSNFTHQQPLNNIIRGTYQALAAALGGVQSMGVSGYDEAVSSPTEAAHAIALNTHHILQREANVTGVVDPLGGSYFVEWLTNEVERRSWDYLGRIAEHGGFIAALESGWLHQEALHGALHRERRTASGERKSIGVNCFAVEGEEHHGIEVFRHNPDTYAIQLARLQQLRQERDNERVGATLGALRRACDEGENVVRPLMAAVKAYATTGEVGRVFREAFGTWKFPMAI